MAWNVTALKYGWKLAAGITLGATIYVASNVRWRVSQADVVELALGVTERCFALQYQTNPIAYRVAPPTFIRSWYSNSYATQIVSGVTSVVAVVWTNVVTNTIGWRTDRAMMVELDAKIFALITNYLDTNAIHDHANNNPYYTVTGLFASLQVGDRTNQFTRTPEWVGTNGDTHAATYGDYPWQIYPQDLEERFKVLNALKVTSFDFEATNGSVRAIMETFYDSTRWRQRVYRTTGDVTNEWDWNYRPYTYAYSNSQSPPYISTMFSTCYWKNVENHPTVSSGDGWHWAYSWDAELGDDYRQFIPWTETEIKETMELFWEKGSNADFFSPYADEQQNLIRNPDLPWYQWPTNGNNVADAHFVHVSTLIVTTNGSGFWTGPDLGWIYDKRYLVIAWNQDTTYLWRTNYFTTNVSYNTNFAFLFKAWLPNFRAPNMGSLYDNCATNIAELDVMKSAEATASLTNWVDLIPYAEYTPEGIVVRFTSDGLIASPDSFPPWPSDFGAPATNIAPPGESYVYTGGVSRTKGMIYNYGDVNLYQNPYDRRSMYAGMVTWNFLYCTNKYW